MFVSSEHLRRYPKHIFNDKKLSKVLPKRSQIKPKGCKYTFLTEGVLTTLWGASHTNTFSTMSEESEFVTRTKCVQVTPAQEALLELLSPLNAADYINHLTAVHELGTYFVSDPDLVNLRASYHTSLLIIQLRELTAEKAQKTA